jgi:hypothetical protein
MRLALNTWRRMETEQERGPGHDIIVRIRVAGRAEKVCRHPRRGRASVAERLLFYLQCREGAERQSYDPNSVFQVVGSGSLSEDQKKRLTDEEREGMLIR